MLSHEREYVQLFNEFNEDAIALQKKEVQHVAVRA